MDVRGKDFDRAEKWSDDNVLENRAYFEPDLKSSSLVIDRISKKDEAVYRCRVDFKYAQTRNSKVNLTIIGKLTFILFVLILINIPQSYSWSIFFLFVFNNAVRLILFNILILKR